MSVVFFFFFFSSRRRHTRSLRDWSSDVCSSDLDAVCTGLQLVEHWQDVAEDLTRGRVNLPQEDLARFGCSQEDLAARRPIQGFRRLMAFEVGRAGSLLDEGAPLAGDLGGRAGLAVAAFV